MKMVNLLIDVYFLKKCFNYNPSNWEILLKTCKLEQCSFLDTKHCKSIEFLLVST